MELSFFFPRPKRTGLWVRIPTESPIQVNEITQESFLTRELSFSFPDQNALVLGFESQRNHETKRRFIS